MTWLRGSNPKNRRRSRVIGVAIGAVASCGLAALAGSGRASEATRIPASPQDPFRNRVFNIRNAAAVYMTQRGQDFFQSEIMSILSRNGIELATGRLPQWRYESPVIRLDRLPPNVQAHAPALRAIRAELADWLSNFSLRDPRFAIEVRNAGYDASGLHLSVRADQDLTASLRGLGIGVIAEITIPRLRIDAEQVRGRDTVNTFINQYIAPLPAQPGANRNSFKDATAINHPWLELRDARPLRLRLPIRAQVTREGTLQMEALKPTTNLSELRFAHGHDRPLTLPKIQLQINDQTSTLDTAPIERAIVAKEDDLVRLAIVHIKDFVEQELPARLNDIAFRQLEAGFSTVNQITPPGGLDPLGNRTQLQLALRPSGLSLNPQFLAVGLDGYVVDPDVTWHEATPVQRRPQPPALRALPPTQYDAALTLSQDVLNRIVFLGFQRGSLASIDAGEGRRARIVAPPAFSAAPEGRGRLHVTLELPTTGIKQNLGLTNPFQVELDVIVRVRPTTDGRAFDVVTERIDEATARIHDRYLTWGRLRGSVDDGLREALRKKNSEYARTEDKIASEVMILERPELFGIPIRIKQAEYDPNGYVGLYLEYGAASR